MPIVCLRDCANRQRYALLAEETYQSGLFVSELSRVNWIVDAGEPNDLVGFLRTDQYEYDVAETGVSAVEVWRVTTVLSQRAIGAAT